jgi:hypothetical protein
MPVAGRRGSAAVAEAAFWLARSALVLAGAAFLCYAVVILGLVVASQVMGVRRRPDRTPDTRDGSVS